MQDVLFSVAFCVPPLESIWRPAVPRRESGKHSPSLRREPPDPPIVRLTALWGPAMKSADSKFFPLFGTNIQARGTIMIRRRLGPSQQEFFGSANNGFGTPPDGNGITWIFM